MAADAQETLHFQAEIAQLLDLMVHSLYSNKEIFLRELISNASDAIDRLRFQALSEPALLGDDTNYTIRVSYDKDARTITVADNGIGMSRDEVITNIGTIAKSGTREFLHSLSGDQQHDANLIGQFGVGFYSSFIVAERVTLITRRAGLGEDEAVQWESDGRGDYTLAIVTKPGRGTEVTLHLRADEDELLDSHRLQSIIQRYSDHISVPIVMRREEGDDAGEDEQINRASALWARAKNEISAEEYNEFYKHIAHDYDDPLAYVHSRMEGSYEYILLLFVPKHAPFDMWSRDQQHGVKLYVRRVFIMDDAEQLLPRYLRFVRGVVDSNDLPLNVSREILQQNRLIEVMRSNIVKKVIGLLAEMANDRPDDYTAFWNTFGRVLKEGVIEDNANREALAKLMRFASTTSESQQSVSLEAYKSRMPEGQEKIYYLIAENAAAASESPLLEIFRQKGVEVLLLSDPVDYILETELTTFDGTSLQSISKGELDLSKLDDATPKDDEEPSGVTEIDALLVRIKMALGDQVKSVRVTTRLTSSPACIVTDEHDLDPALRRLLQANGQKVPTMKPILEINPRHPIITRMDREADETRFANWATVIFDQSVLSSGEQLENPVRFVNHLNDLLESL